MNNLEQLPDGRYSLRIKLPSIAVGIFKQEAEALGITIEELLIEKLLLSVKERGREDNPASSQNQ